MDYFSLLRPASFRGIKFLVPSDSTSQAIRIARHEYPQKDEPFHEELGLGVRTFRVEAVIAGDDFITLAAAFESGLLQKGAGNLVHPFYGQTVVIVVNFERNNDYSALGHIVFSVDFEKYGKPLYPRAVGNSASAVLSTSDTAFSGLLSEFNSVFDIGGYPEFVAADAVRRINFFMSEAAKNLSRPQSMFNAVLNNLSSIGQQVQSAFKNIALGAKPFKSSALAGINKKTTAVDAQSLSRLLLNISDNSVVYGTFFTDTRNQSQRHVNAQSLDLMLRSNALIAGAHAAAYAQYASREQAMDMRTRFSRSIEQLGGQLADSGWDESWKNLESLNAALVRDINERIGRLPYTLRIRPSSTRSSLVLANYLYGDDQGQIIVKAEDIVARNKIRNPALIPAETMEVLVNA